MQKIPFSKYHGAGNDFILIDDRLGMVESRINTEWIEAVCHRRFGIGADGLILLQKGSEDADFFMKYYNSDGKQSTFCGNGGRCIVSYASHLGIHHGNTKFLGTDGWHEGSLNTAGLVRLSMTDVNEIVTLDDHTFTVYTGSPHYVTFLDNIQNLDVQKEGRTIRNSPRFEKEGINVNFAEITVPSEIRIRTYERGVEDETMACGTGVVASAIAYTFFKNNSSSHCVVHTQGGELLVEFTRNGLQAFSNITLTGPAVEVFRGEVLL